MNINDLMYDLSYGIRLPTPKFCPPPIANLVKECFYENPDLRPDFKNITNTLEILFEELMARHYKKRKASDKTARPSDYHPINTMKNNVMKSRYAKIVGGNKKFVEKRENYAHIKNDDELEDDTEIDSSPVPYAIVQEGPIKNNVMKSRYLSIVRGNKKIVEKRENYAHTKNDDEVEEGEEIDSSPVPNAIVQDGPMKTNVMKSLYATTGRGNKKFVDKKENYARIKNDDELEDDDEIDSSPLPYTIVQDNPIPKSETVELELFLDAETEDAEKIKKETKYACINNYELKEGDTNTSSTEEAILDN